MKRSLFEQPNGYTETISRGMAGVRMLSREMTRGRGTRAERIARLKTALGEADAVVIGAGAGLSTSAGLTYYGERFEKYFSDFAAKYGIRDMYSGGFYPFPTEEIRWAWWARHIYYNRYIDPPKPVYEELLELVKDKDYFVITTNVDHMFQKAGFDKKRLFYTQGDYGLFQQERPTAQQTWDNEQWVMKAMEAQGFVKDEDGVFQPPEEGDRKMEIPTSLIPRWPEDGSPVTTNLRADDSFVEDEGWHRASAAYSDFLRRHSGLKVLFLELGVGSNTPVIIKYPFWQMVRDNPNATYACLNFNEAYCPKEIEDRSTCLDGDIGAIIKEIRQTGESV